jgi:nitrile hydratase
MNSIHDYGGMDGFTLPARDQGPILKEEWERELWGLVISVWSKAIPGYHGGSRYDLEQIPPELYIDMPYYAKWLYGEEKSLLRSGLATAEELKNPDGPMSMPDFSGFVPARSADVIAFLTGDDSNELPAEVPPRFSVGDEVIVKNNHPAGHTRVPRYTRGHRGVIQNHHGVHRFQDHVAEDPGQQHLYTVMFTGPELWGSRGNAKDRIGADLWEIHLEPAS